MLQTEVGTWLKYGAYWLVALRYLSTSTGMIRLLCNNTQIAFLPPLVTLAVLFSSHSSEVDSGIEL